MGFIEAVLALIGLVGLIGAAVRRHLPRLPGRPPEEDRAAPYREGLHAAVRIQGVAHDLEQQIYAEALRHAKGDPKRP
jgi:hypothetical protein